MIRRTVAALAVLTLAVAGSAAAHEGHAHGATRKMMGTIKAVHADMNRVEITANKGTTGFYVDANTKYVRGGATLALADLKPGTRVIVTARTEGEKVIADEVKVAGHSPASAGRKP
jgi:hypothetical protein